MILRKFLFFAIKFTGLNGDIKRTYPDTGRYFEISRLLMLQISNLLPFFKNMLGSRHETIYNQINLSVEPTTLNSFN